MRALRRIALVVLIVLLVVGVGLYLATRFYLSSSNVTGQVSTRLQAMLGAPVLVQSADVGLTGGSSLHGLRIFEPGDQTKKAPIITVDSATADASALDLAEGKSPNEVTLTGASIALHFGPDGKLLTRMPRPKTGGGPMPHVHIDNGKLTLDQDGRAPMVIQGVKLDLTSDGGDLKATGAVADPFWGDWSLDGSFKNESGAVDLTLTAKDVQVDAARLKGLAFVPPDVWREVLVTGKTSCTFNLGLQLADDPAIHYRVACAPTDAKVHVESIKLDATGASGNVVVDDNLVQLRGVHGRFSGGEIATDGDLDFRKPDWTLLFSTISVNKVVLHDLPAEWRHALLPEAIRRLGLEGQLTGQATNVRVAPVNGQVKVTGEGQGEIDQVVVAGQSQQPPIKLKLGSKNGQLGSVSLNPTPDLPELVLAAALVAVPPSAPPAAPTPPALPDLKPTDLVGWVPRALVWATGRGVIGLNKGITFLGGLIKPAPEAAEPAPEYLDIDLALEDVDLGQLLQRLQFKLPFPVEGKLSFKVHASIPINTPRDMKNYRLTGTANLPRVNVAGVEMADVATRLTLDNGLLELQELKGRAILPAGGAGTFAGTARMRIAPLGDLTADLNVDRFPLAAVLNLLPGAGGKADGSLTGHVTARAPAQTLTDLATWHTKATLSSDRIAAYGLELTAVSADLSVDAGKAKASSIKATLEKAALTGSAELVVASPWNYSALLTLSGADLKAVQGLNPDFRPPFPVEGAADVTADLKGTLRPLTVAASGSAKASDLTLDRFKVDSLSVKWDLDGDRLKLTDAKAALYQGDVTGTATLPLRATTAGAVDLRLDGVDVQALAKSLPAVPVQVSGKASGTVAATLPPAGPDGERAATAKVDLTAKKLSVQNIPADNLHADVDYKAGAATYHLEGESLGGRFKLDGKYPSREGAAPGPGGAAKEPPPEASSGRFQFNDIRLSRLGEALGLGTGLGQLHGQADIDLPFRAVADGVTASGTGRLTVRNLGLGDTPLTDRLTADLILRDQTVQVRNLSASVNQGAFRGTVVYNYANPERSRFNLQLEQADAAALLAGYPDLAAQVQGPVDLRLRGNLGREWRGSGEAALTRGRVYGVEVEEWRLPFTFTFHPRHGNGQLTVSDSNVQLSHGRIAVQADLHWSYDTAPRLTGNARFYNADLHSLLRSDGQLGSYAVGQLTGRVDFSADSLRSADDLEATVAATLTQSQALQIPVLSALVPFIAPGRSATTFDSGELRGRLSRGIFRIQKLNLSSRITGLNVVGTITTTGRLDLEATAGTGRLGVNPNFLQALGVTIPAVGPIPVGVLLEVSAYLSNRVIHLRVTGTTRNPQVRTEPIRLLAEEALRFFV